MIYPMACEVDGERVKYTVMGPLGTVTLTGDRSGALELRAQARYDAGYRNEP